jgi:ornithine cyclodeaminase
MPLLILIDAQDGAVLAIIEAFALGQMRTGGISGLGADVMARADARRMAIVGAGKQSLAQVAAVAAVRPLDRVTVWSPTAANREALAARIEETLRIEAIATATLDEALDGADVVTLATRARTPFLTRDALPRGVHINAVGAITPERAEFEPALLERAGVLAADSVPQVRKLSREFIEALGDDEGAWARLQPLSALVAAGTTRPADADLTVFKAMGMGISDLSLGIAVLKRARRRSRPSAAGGQTSGAAPDRLILPCLQQGERHERSAHQFRGHRRKVRRRQRPVLSAQRSLGTGDHHQGTDRRRDRAAGVDRPARERAPQFADRASARQSGHAGPGDLGTGFAERAEAGRAHAGVPPQRHRGQFLHPG